MARQRRRRRKSAHPDGLDTVDVGQRVVVSEYGAGTVVAVECRRGIYYSDAWVRPDEAPWQEVGVRYEHGIFPAEDS